MKRKLKILEMNIKRKFKMGQKVMLKEKKILGRGIRMRLRKLVICVKRVWLKWRIIIEE